MRAYHKPAMQKIIPAYASSFTQKQITLWFCLVSLLGIPSTGQADIYRFVTIDGIESFTDAPLLKEAKVLIKDTAKSSRKGSAKALSKESIRKSAPSLQEIIEKTVQAQLPRQTSRQSSPETILPVDGRITSGVGMRIDPLDGSWRQHNGIDIAVPEGTPVKAVSDGTVLYADLRSGYGWTVLLEHDSGMITLYAHNSRINVAVGQSIKKMIPSRWQAIPDDQPAPMFILKHGRPAPTLLRPLCRTVMSSWPLFPVITAPGQVFTKWCWQTAHS